MRGIRPLFRGDGGRPDAGRPVAEKLRAMKLERIASFVETSVEETLPYMEQHQEKPISVVVLVNVLRSVILVRLLW